MVGLNIFKMILFASSDSYVTGIKIESLKETNTGVSLNGGFSPQIIHFNRVFHYKPSILGETPLF